jgi:ABC-2 type transport system ATP-binding protein
MFAVEVENLTKRFGDFCAVDHLKFNVAEGEIFGLLGPNGAGKSTLIRMLTTLVPPTEGTARVNGFDVVKNANQVRQSIGVIPQAMTSDLDLSAYENMSIFAKLYGIPREKRLKTIKELLQAVDLEQWTDKPVKMFSGGMRRRLEIARALTHRPEVLILDEPTVGLDPQTRRAVWDHLLSIASTHERTVFVTTHYMDEAERCGDVAILDHGKLIARGSPRQIVERAGVEKLVVQSEDDARVVQSATGLGLSAKPGASGVEVWGERAEVMLAKLGALALGLREVSIVRPRLEDAFVALTGRDIRDEPDAGAGNKAAMQRQLRARGRTV